MSYFIRFTENPQADAERGYSFVGYVLMDTPEKAYEFHAEVTGEAFEDNFELESYIEENPGLVGQDNVSGKWGVTRSGLCGFGPFETAEAAEADYLNNPNDYAQYSGPTTFHIFEGKQTFVLDQDGQDDGVTFAPKAVVK